MLVLCSHFKLATYRGGLGRQVDLCGRRAWIPGGSGGGVAASHGGHLHAVLAGREHQGGGPSATAEAALAVRRLAHAQRGSRLGQGQQLIL